MDSLLLRKVLMVEVEGILMFMGLSKKAIAGVKVLYKGIRSKSILIYEHSRTLSNVIGCGRLLMPSMEPYGQMLGASRISVQIFGRNQV